VVAQRGTGALVTVTLCYDSYSLLQVWVCMGQRAQVRSVHRPRTLIHTACTGATDIVACRPTQKTDTLWHDKQNIVVRSTSDFKIPLVTLILSSAITLQYVSAHHALLSPFSSIARVVFSRRLPIKRFFAALRWRRFGVAVARWSRSTRLSYIGPG